MANFYYTQALTNGSQLDRENYAKGLGTGQYPMSGVDLRHIGASSHATLEDVPLNRKVSTLYAIEVIAPDGVNAIYEGNQGQSLTLWLGAKVMLNNSGDVGVVVGIKDMWSGDVKRMTMSPSPDDVRLARKNTGLTQEQAAQVIGATRRAWQEWEAGRRNMPPAKWELFQKKIREESIMSDAKKFFEMYADVTDLMTALDASRIESNQDWDNETTTWTFSDGSKIRVSGPDAEVIE